MPPLRDFPQDVRLVHHCHIVTIRGNSYRMRQHTDLWHALHAAQEPDAAPNRRRRRQEAAGDLRLVPSSICQIFTPWKCQIFDRR